MQPEYLSDTSTIEEQSAAGSSLKASGKARLLSLDELDGRTLVARYVRQTRAEVLADLGGEENLSTLERVLVDSVVMAAAMLRDKGARWMTGEEVDATELCTLQNAFNRSAASLGWRRRSKDITPDLRRYLQKGEAA